MSEINPNTPVTEVQTTNDKGSVELNSTSALTFDELDEITSKSRRAKASSKKETEDKDDKTESKTEKSVDLSSDTDKGKSPKDGKEKSPDKEQKQDKEVDEAKQAAQLRKLIKAKFQDKEIDLDEESLIPVKVNGKDELVAVKDLMGNYSGKTAWDKKFTELSKKEKTSFAQEQKLKQAAESVRNMFEEQDPDVKMFKMAKLAGIDPVQYRKSFFDDNMNLLEKYYAMSESERTADASAFEAKYHKHRADTLETSSKQEQSQRELLAKIESLRASHQVSEEDYQKYSNDINLLVSEGVYNKSQVTPELVIETAEKERLWSAADTVLQNLEVAWSTEERQQKIYKLVENAHKLGISPADLPEIIDETWGPKKTQKKMQQISQERQEFLSGKKEVTQVKPKTESAMFFEEIL